MIFDWNDEKNKELQEKRNIGFENVIVAINQGYIIDVLEHPNKEKYGNQYLIIIEIDNYAYVVPVVIDEEIYFLKTIFPSRKYTKKYLKNKKGDKNEK